jgi:aspartate aminotransferase
MPSWGNHTPVFRDSGLEVRSYRYFDKKTVGLDFEGLKTDLLVIRAPYSSVMLLSICVGRLGKEHRPAARVCTQPDWRGSDAGAMG